VERRRGGEVEVRCREETTGERRKQVTKMSVLGIRHRVQGAGCRV
jgi:hypothetical protein